LSAIDGVELGNVTNMIAKIQPSIQSITAFEGEKSG